MKFSQNSVMLLLVAACMAPIGLAKSSDPVVMTIGKTKVPLSEFEYLYRKNSSQQMTPMSIDEYADLFAVYKMKVAEAKDAHIDTTSAFKTEFLKYRNELASPALRDHAVEEQLINQAYSHFNRDVKVSHIMVAKGNTEAEHRAAWNMLDSLRSTIASNADFAVAAAKYSIDRGSSQQGGSMGWITAGRYPYEFENAAYETPVGDISPVIATDFGYHIVTVDDSRPARGEVLARHILKLTRGKDEAGQALAKHQIDSIYKVLTAGGADFEAIAKAESEDPGSARDGGMLPWFGPGQMVPEFEAAAFGLTDGAISEPFATSYGYHIVNRLGSRQGGTLDERRPSIIKMMERDGRINLSHEARMKQLRELHGAKLDVQAIDAFISALSVDGVIDSLYAAQCVKKPVALAKVGKKNAVTTATVLTDINPKSLGPEFANNIRQRIDKLVDELVVEAEIANMIARDADFRNLINEYFDGMLLFEVSNAQVWQRAAADLDGQQRYFEAHRGDYTWDSPKYKGFIIYTSTDSVADEMNKFLATNPAVDSLQQVVADKFGRSARIEPVLAGKGENRVIDYYFFGGPAIEARKLWKNSVVYGGSFIDAPQEAADVRGRVVSDYQAQLEKEWVEQLKSKYKVKVNKKVLNSLR